MTTATKQIATTILNQLGGNMFRMMTGAKDFVALPETSTQAGGIAFKIGRNSKGVNKVVVRLTWMDTYQVEFQRVRKLVAVTLVQADDVYCDQLASLFEDATGMYTRL